VAIAGGQLYAATNDSNGGSSADVWQVGTGLPTTAATLSTLPNLQTAYNAALSPDSPNPEQLLFLNTSDGTSNNPDLLYVADQANGLLKFWKNVVSISTLTESGTTVTVTTSAANTLVDGQQVQISGASVSGYNGTFTIHVTDSTHFTYTASTSGLASATGGSATQWTYGSTTGNFGQKLLFSGGGTGVVGFINNPRTSTAPVQLSVTR